MRYCNGYGGLWWSSRLLQRKNARSVVEVVGAFTTSPGMLSTGRSLTRAACQRREWSQPRRLGDVTIEGGRIMLRRTIAICALMSVLVPSAAYAHGKPAYSCAPGFNLGAYDKQGYLQLPRTQALIADGLATVEDIEATFDLLDANGNGWVCVQLSVGFQQHGPYSVYYYNVTDDHASVPL